MSIASAITRFRAKQAEQFTTTATVYRPIGELETNPNTGEVTETFDTIYNGPCKIRPKANRSTDEVDTAETQVALPDFTGKFPVDTDIQRGDIVTVTACTLDAGMAGKSYTVVDASNDQWQISRVVGLEQIVVPLLNGGS